ncbi:hypothetical protein [Streptomyces sp. bgisy022]|uniref:hypothetical protein n=1 Tax=Streptomyces sp. bgisy022 TaxID=3413769 RepID=UPI003D75EDA6
MGDMGFVYSGAAAAGLSLGALLLIGRPGSRVWRDVPAVVIGLGCVALAFLVATVADVAPTHATAGALLWGAGTGQAAHLVRRRLTDRARRSPG